MTVTQTEPKTAGSLPQATKTATSGASGSKAAAAKKVIEDGSVVWTPEEFRKIREGLELSRVIVAKATDTTESLIWRAERTDGKGKRLSPEEHDKIVAFLVKCRDHGVPQEYRRTARTFKHVTKRAQTIALLDEALAAKTLKEAKELITQAREVVKS